MSEHDEQVLVVDYLHKAYPNVLFFSVPNGATLSSGDRRLAAIRMNMLKKEGLLPGVSDIIIFEPRGGYSAMALEMKDVSGGNGASDNQLHFIREFEQRGGFGVIADGFDDAKQRLDDYLQGRIVK